eukprot:3460865-Rhodomonas_salina.5
MVLRRESVFEYGRGATRKVEDPQDALFTSLSLLLSASSSHPPPLPRHAHRCLLFPLPIPPLPQSSTPTVSLLHTYNPEEFRPEEVYSADATR